MGIWKEVAHTLRSTTVSGILNSPTIQRGIAPPHGFALSILRSNITVSIPFSCAKISAAQAPEGPPPTTATLYFMDKEVSAAARCATGVVCTKDEGEKAAAVEANVAIVASVNFILFLIECVNYALSDGFNIFCSTERIGSNERKRRENGRQIFDSLRSLRMFFQTSTYVCSLPMDLRMLLIRNLIGRNAYLFLLQFRIPSNISNYCILIRHSDGRELK
jgi:hypothetical protein